LIDRLSIREGADVAWANTPSQAEADNTIVTTAMLVNALMDLFPERVDSMGEGTKGNTPSTPLNSRRGTSDHRADKRDRLLFQLGGALRRCGTQNFHNIR